MRSIQRRFKHDCVENPNLSTLICFGRAISGQNFSKQRISKYFSILVEKSDYLKKDRKAIITNFGQLSNNSEAYQIRSIFAPRGFVFVKTEDGEWIEK